MPVHEALCGRNQDSSMEELDSTPSSAMGLLQEWELAVPSDAVPQVRT